jgi:hypothetical protein
MKSLIPGADDSTRISIKRQPYRPLNPNDAPIGNRFFPEAKKRVARELRGGNSVRREFTDGQRRYDRSKDRFLGVLGTLFAEISPGKRSARTAICTKR